jgi:Spy/CpxP family protein refolding chaperone
LAGLDLTQDQKDRIAGIHDAHARAMIQSRADLRIARLELGKLLRSETPDERAIDAQIDRIASIRAAMAKSRVGAHLELRSILTEEQRAKLHGSRPRAGRGESDRSPRRDRRRP